VSRRIGPSRPVISIILGFGSSLVPVAIALFVVNLRMLSMLGELKSMKLLGLSKSKLRPLDLTRAI
jgi:hypothetical protein